MSSETNFSHDRGILTIELKAVDDSIYTTHRLKTGYIIFKVQTQYSTYHEPSRISFFSSKIALGNYNVHTERVKVMLLDKGEGDMYIFAIKNEHLQHVFI